MDILQLRHKRMGATGNGEHQRCGRSSATRDHPEAVRTTRGINHQKTSREHQGMRTTMTCAAITPENKLLYAWAGDSRIYRFSHRDGLLQLTRDHTLLEEKNQTGRRASPGDAHILTKSLGGNQVFEAANGHLQLEKDDLVLLTTDGLTSVVSDHDIETALRAAHTDLETTAVSLIDLALSGGGPDNITALLCRVQTD